MNIGIDIDGVLTNIEKYQLEVARKFYKKKYNIDIKNEKGFTVKEIYGVDKKGFMDFWTKHLLSYSIKELSRAGASECINKLVNEGNTIYIITSREFADKDNILGTIMRHIVKYWLKREGIPYEKNVFCSEDKVTAIKNNNIQVMIEDGPKNIEEISKYTDVICMDAKYNKDIILPRVRHVSNFDEVYTEVNNIRQDVINNLVDPIGVKAQRNSIDNPHRKFYNEKQSNIFLTDESAYEFIYRKNKDNLSADALDYFDNKITFKEFFKKIDECAAALKSNGVKRKDIVTICMPNTPEGVISFYAVNKIGAVANMVHPLAAEEEIKHYLQETNSKFVITIDAAANKINNILSDTDVEKVVVANAGDSMPTLKKVGYKTLSFAKKHKLISMIDEISCNIINGLKLCKNKQTIIPDSLKKTLKSINNVDIDGDKFISYKSFISSGKKNKGVVPVKFEKDELAVLLHTGGSTGLSKGVMLSNENINANTIQLQYTIPHYKAHDKLLAITPIFHGFGLVDCIHTALGVNMSVILLPQFDKKSYTKAVLKKPALILGVPTLLDVTINLDELKNIKQPYNVFICGGDHLQLEKEKAANEFSRTHGGPIDTCKGGGMTEATAAYTFTMEGANKLESVGVPLPLNKIKIVDQETGMELMPGEVGEIWLSGPTVMLGYYKNEKATENALKRDKNGRVWLRTGDLGYVDENGLLSYSGRIKRMIISSGYNVYPQEIEKIILTHPSVDSAVCIGIDDERKGKVAKVIIKTKDGVTNVSQIIKELIDICLKNLPTYSIPVGIEVVDSFPMTLYNKIDYRKIEKDEEEKIKQNVKVKIKGA